MSTLNRRYFAFAALATLALCAFTDRRAAADPLVAAESSDDADITGQVWAQMREDGDRLVVNVANAGPGRVLEAVVLDADGNESSLGSRAASIDGNAHWSIDTAFGGELPFDAWTVDDLVGAQIIVRDATYPAIVLLDGTIPTPVSSIVDQDGREGIPRVGAPVGSEAHVRVAHRTGHAARELFAVDVAGLDAGTVLAVWLEIPGVPGSFSNVGSLTVGDYGTGKLTFSTRDGGDLPFDVLAAMDLVGLHVQVRNQAGVVYFAGVVPPAVHH